MSFLKAICTQYKVFHFISLAFRLPPLNIPVTNSLQSWPTPKVNKLRLHICFWQFWGQIWHNVCLWFFFPLCTHLLSQYKVFTNSVRSRNNIVCMIIKDIDTLVFIHSLLNVRHKLRLMIILISRHSQGCIHQDPYIYIMCQQ